MSDWKIWKIKPEVSCLYRKGGCETFWKDQSHGDEKHEEAYKMIESANIAMSL